MRRAEKENAITLEKLLASKATVTELRIERLELKRKLDYRNKVITESKEKHSKEIFESKKEISEKMLLSRL